jgi:hypothetical protein
MSAAFVIRIPSKIEFFKSEFANVFVVTKRLKYQEIRQL